jgi:Ca-activated chloride channel family protein
MQINATLDVDLVALEEQDTVSVMLDITAPEGDHETARPAQAIVVVLDRSGSMSGERLHMAKKSLLALVGRLDARDSFGLVTFHSEARVEVPADTVASLGRDRILHRIAGIAPGGMTDMSSGYLRGLQEARRVVGDGGATVLLLSDGHANTGTTDPQAFQRLAAKAVGDRITTSSIGIGIGYDDGILGELAVGGAGNHTFAENPDAAGAAVIGEVTGLLSKTAQAVSLLVKPTGDVTGVTVLNDLPAAAVSDGVMVELGDFYASETRRLLLSLDVPAIASLGLARVASLELSYVRLPEMEQETVTVPVSVNVVPSDEAAGRSAQPEVRRERLLLETQTAKRASEDALRAGDADRATTVLKSSRAALARMFAQDTSEELEEEIGFIDRTLEDIQYRDAMYSTRRMSSDRRKKARGMRRREQGGSWDADGTYNPEG